MWRAEIVRVSYRGARVSVERPGQVYSWQGLVAAIAALTSSRSKSLQARALRLVDRDGSIYHGKRALRRALMLCPLSSSSWRRSCCWTTGLGVSQRRLASPATFELSTTLDTDRTWPSVGARLTSHMNRWVSVGT